MYGLIVLWLVNSIGIGYVVTTGIRQLRDVQILTDTPAQMTTEDAIVLRFNTPMLQSTVAASLQITPTHPYQLLWTDDGQQLTIRPDIPWVNATAYTVRLTDSVQSRTGRYIAYAWEQVFTTRRMVQIRQVLPAPNQADVVRDSMVVVRFGQQMVTQAMVGVLLDQMPIQIFPPVNGVSKWLDSRTLAFQPAIVFAPNQEYAITIPTQLSDVNGASLSSSYTWRFRTMAARIVPNQTQEMDQEFGLQQSIVLTVTGQIDPIRLQQTMLITPSVNAQLAVTPLDGSLSRLEITPTSGWQSDTNYQLTLGGGESALVPFSTAFRTAPTLRLVARTPGEGESVGNDREVRFIFNTLLDTSTISDAISITPAPIQPARITSTGRDIRIAANWEVQVNPLIQISSTLLSSQGISLTTPISSELRIDPRQALVTLPGTPREIYDASDSTTFQLQIIPNRTALLRIYDLPVATLVRMVDMDVANFLAIDPARYNLPLLNQQQLQSTDGSSRITVNIMDGIEKPPLSRIWLVQLISANGSQDVRLMRIQPATLHAISLPQQLAVGIQVAQVPQPGRQVLVFQSGQLINQGITNDNGIWQSPSAITNPLVIIDAQQPIDAHKLTPLTSVSTNTIHVVVDRPYAAQGDQLTVLMARPSDDVTRTARLRIHGADGELVSEQPVVFDADTTITSTRIRLPNQLIPGVYTLSMALDGQLAQQPIVIYDRLRLDTDISHERMNDTYLITVRDQYGQALSNQPVYWVSHSQSGRGTSDYRGSITIPMDSAPVSLLMVTNQGSVIHHITPILPQRRIELSRANWFTADQPVTLGVRIIDDEQVRNNRIIQVEAQNDAGQTTLRQRVVTNEAGSADISLMLPQGAWSVRATSADLQASIPVWVGMSRTNDVFARESDELVIGQRPRWIKNTSAGATFLVAQRIQQEFTVEWQQSDATGIIATAPISQTGMLQSVIGPAGKPFEYSTHYVRNLACPATVQINANARDQLLSVQFIYAPASRILFNLYDATQQQLIAENISMQANENGIVEFQIPDNGVTQSLYVSAIAIREDCYGILTQNTTVVRSQRLLLNAPEVVRIGDIVGVTVSIDDTQPGQTTLFRLDPTGLIIVDTLPQYSVTSDQQGRAQVTWRYRVTAQRTKLVIDSAQSPPLMWQPTVIAAPVSYSNDGFVLRGTSSIEASNELPVLLDIVATSQQLQQSFSRTPYETTNPSHIAHRIWHTISPTDRTILLQQLLQLKLPNGAWGWAGSQTADPLITADVVIALTQSLQPMTAHQGALQYLQQQLQNPKLPPSVRALVAYALTLNQQPPIEELLLLSRTPHLLGNEGLAALLLSMPSEYAYTIPPIVNELLQRVQSAPRGVIWAHDHATDSLHNRENVNALIYQAMAHANVASDVRLQLGIQLLSMRGVNGWTDSISNARIWSHYQLLLPTLPTNPTVKIINDTGQTIHTGTMSPAQIMNQNGRIQSDTDVLIGIARSRNMPTPTGDATVWLQLYRPNGSLITDDSNLTLGDEVIVRVSVAFFDAIPHVIIMDPQSSLSAIVAPPNASTTTSVFTAPHMLTLHTGIDTAQLLHYQYRIRLNHTGRSLLEPIEIRDGSGTLHAQSQAVMVSVVAP